jgi:hypothetical protein
MTRTSVHCSGRMPMIDLMVVVFLVSAVVAEQGDDLARKNVEVDPMQDMGSPYQA